MATSALLAEVLDRPVDEASRPGADEAYLRPQMREDMEAPGRYKKRIQGIMRYLQNLKKVSDERLKDLRQLRSSVRSHGD